MNDISDYGFELPGLSDMSADDLVQPEAPEVPEAPDYGAQIAALEQRLAETQRWAQQSNAGKDMYEAIARARQEEENQRTAREQAAAVYNFPELSDEDRDALVADPDAVERRIHAVAQVYANRAHGNLAPRVQQAELIAQIAGPLIEAEAERVASAVRRSAIDDDGIPEDQVDGLLQAARQNLWQASGNDGGKYARFTLNPQAVRAAFRMAVDSAPAPVRRSPRAPSIGGGDPSASRGGGAGGLVTSANYEAAKIGRALGVSFTKDDIEDVRTKMQNRRR